MKAPVGVDVQEKWSISWSNQSSVQSSIGAAITSFQPKTRRHDAKIIPVGDMLYLSKISLVIRMSVTQAALKWVVSVYDTNRDIKQSNKT